MLAAAQLATADTTAKDFEGTYILSISSPQKSVPTQWVCEITANTVLVDKKKWGTWVLDGNAAMVTAVQPNRGEVKLRTKGHETLVGQHTGGAQSAKWSLQRVYVVSRWTHQAGNSAPIELRFWSTGRVGEPDGRVRWTINAQKAELVIKWPETTDVCRLSPDGLRYEGKNEHGTLITGKLVTNP